MLKGQQLLKVVKAMAGANRSDLVRHCGYVSVRDDGQEQLHFAEFYGALLEASGGLTLDSVYEVGDTGVDFIAVGALTHSARVLDIGADLRSLDGEDS